MTNKVAVITGAAGGIGRAVARRFIEDGYYVALVGRSASNLNNALPEILGKNLLAEYHAYAMDASDPLDVYRFYESLPHPVNALVNCAAGPAVVKSILDTSYADWTSTLRNDLTSTFLMCQGAARLMKEQRSGRIINFASYHALGSYPNRCAYASAKGAVVALSQQLAVELGPHGITVNVASPGAILTPRTAGFLETDPTLEQGLINRTPTRRLGTVEDVADTVAWLASEGARHINGQNIVVAGGYEKNLWPLN